MDECSLRTTYNAREGVRGLDKVVQEVYIRI